MRVHPLIIDRAALLKASARVCLWRWADTQQRGEEAAPGGPAHTDTGLGAQQAPLSVAKGTFLTEHDLGSPSTFTNSEMLFSWHTLSHFVPSQQCTGIYQPFSLHPKGWAGLRFPDNLLFRQQKLRLRRLTWNPNIESYNFLFSTNPSRNHRTLLLQSLPQPPQTHTIIHFYLNSWSSRFLVKPQSLKMTSSTCHNPLCGRNRHTISHCSQYNTLSCTFCSEHTETPLEAPAISMQEAKENLVSDLIRDKSMHTHLLLIVPISSRRDTVLEFQGYPCCLCLRKTYLALWDILKTPFERFPGVWARDWKSLNPQLILTILSTRFWERLCKFAPHFRLLQKFS